MEDPLIENCERGISIIPMKEREIESTTGESSSTPVSYGTKSPSKSRAANKHHVVHPLSGGAINCLLTVDSVVRATADLGTPRKISLAVPTPGFPVNIDGDENEALFLPLQNTRHLFIREYKKPFKWPMQATRRFQILNSSGECIYFAAETSSYLSRMVFLRGIFPYNINVLSLNGDKIMGMQCRPFFSNCITLKDSRGELMGKISKGTHNWCVQSYSLKTWDGTEILNIVGPDGSNCCLFADCGNDDFEVNLGDGTTAIGKISAEWEYALENLCGVFVPMKLDELTMSLLLGAVFLIDFNFYQRRRDASCFGRCFMTFSFFALFILLLFLIAKK